MKTLAIIAGMLLFTNFVSAQQQELIAQDAVNTGLDGYYRFIYNGEERGLHIDVVNNKFEEFDKGIKVGEGDIDVSSGLVTPNGVFEGSIINSKFNYTVQSSNEKFVVIEIQSNEGPIIVELEKI